MHLFNPMWPENVLHGGNMLHQRLHFRMLFGFLLLIGCPYGDRGRTLLRKGLDITLLLFRFIHCAARF